MTSLHPPPPTPGAPAHTVLFDWNLDQFDELVRNCAEDDTVNLALRFLPATGLVLEAGCGPGHVVAYLREKGFDIEGVELNALVVEEALRRHPGLRIAVGDVATLPVPDGTYAGLLSFGVIEHFPAGPEAPLAEHRRVLRPGGVAIISVPSYNRLRRLEHGLRALLRPLRPRNFPPWRPRGRPLNIRGRDGFRFHVDPRQGPFFEYWLRPAEFEQAIRAAGFEIVASLPTHHLVGLWSLFGDRLVRNEARRFRPTAAARWLDRLLRSWPYCHNHMHTIVARRLA
ncbi:MAG: class I SAM-dependent methyltransferase [Opitutaceae bacterium]|nr:class I SAM-dependent methyltransferase [Opitutaceae bacterium]